MNNLLQSNRYPAKYTAMIADEVTGTPPVIDNDHTYIHEGRGFTASFYGTSTGKLDFLLTTPAATVTSPYIHFRPVAVTSNKEGVLFKVFENSTKVNSTAAAAPLALVNRNRNSSKTSGCVLTGGLSAVFPSGSTGAGGTHLVTYYAGGGSGQGQTSIGGSITGINEWVLKPATKYNIVFTTTAATKVGARFFLYTEDEG